MNSEKFISLPVEIESHAIVHQWNDSLWLFINRFSEQHTQVYQLTSDWKLNEIVQLPLMSSSVVSCNTQLMVTGSNTDGKPVLIALAKDGNQLWSQTYPQLNPIIWPIASCEDNIVLAWQESIHSVEVGRIRANDKSMERPSSIEIVPPLATLISEENQLLGFWVNRAKVHKIDLLKNEETVLELNDNEAYNHAFGISKGQPFVGWTSHNKVHFKWLKKDTVTSLPIPSDNIGETTAISGPTPLLWAQNYAEDIDEERTWTSILLMPDGYVSDINEYVFTVGWYQNKLIVVHPNRLRIITIP